jgi:filamentous hemagglutinin family protein
MRLLHSTKQTVFTPLCLLTGLTITCSPFFNTPAVAQIIPDNSLGNENSVVVPNQNINGINSDRIDGGAIRNSNLFHSFQEFNIDNGRGAYFSNPENISNILTRVTGSNISNIFGTLGILGNANLFLINPNGIVFGPNARLDVGGSFFASTADSILFENSVEFAASNSDAPPLLTINIPIGLNFRENPGNIVNQSIAVDSEDNFVGLQVLPRRTLGFVGGDIQLANSVLTAPQGRIELGSVAGNSTVNLTPIDKGYALGYENVQNFQDIALAQALLDVRGEGGGDVQIQGRRVTLADVSIIEASTEGSQPGGVVSIQASESVEVIGSSIFADVNPGAMGAGGNLIINTQNLLVQNGSQISTSIFGTGNGGNLTVTATNIELIGTTPDGQSSSTLIASVQSGGVGNGGNLTINAQNLRVFDGAQISVSTFSNGNGGNLNITAEDIKLSGIGSGLLATFGEEAIGKSGDITINTQNISVQNGARVSVSTLGNEKAGNLTIDTHNLLVSNESLVISDTFGQGDAGQLIIRATGLVEITDAMSFITTDAESGSTGNGGVLTINAQRLLVKDGAQIGAGTFGSGNGGDLTITATDIEVVSDSVVGNAVQSGATGNGGTLTLNTQRLLVKDGAQVGAGTFGNGDGGDLNITANTIELIGASSGLFTTVEPGAVGNAGTLTIDTQRLIAQDSAQISAATNGQGDGANLTINATDVELIGISANGQFPSGLFTSVDNGATGDGGILTLNTQRLSVRDGAQITATTFVDGDAGDLIVNATDIELVGTSANGRTASGLFADVEPESTGKGGELRVSADNLTIRDGARIDVRSEGIEAAGDLIINAPNILLDNQASLNGETTAGEGDIILNTDDLRLRNNSNITTNATGEATGGNITINTETLTALENSDISANAEDAFGGRVIVNADGILGAAFRTQQSQFSDITATSELGPEFSGTVELNTELDPSSGLIDLTQTVVDPNDLIAQEFCRQRGGSEFVVTGRGGIAVNPNDKSDGNQINVDLVEPVPAQPRNTSQQRSETDENQPISSLDIVLARGWIRDENGDVILVSYDPTKTGVQRQQHNPYSCQH